MAMLLGTKSLLLSLPKTPSSPFFFTCFRFSAPSIAPSPPSSPPTTPSAIFQFLETQCGFSPPQISKIMQAHKSLMRVRSTQTARQAVEFLREWGFTDSQLHTTILRCPSVLCLRVYSQLKPMFDYLTVLGFPKQDLRNLISRGSRLLGSSLDRNIKPRIPFLEKLLISRGSRLLGSSLDRNIKPRILFLEKLFGSKASLIKGLTRAPSFLVISIEKQLKPKINVSKKWGIEGELLSLLLSAYPNALARSSMELIETRVEYVRNTVGIVEGSKAFVYAVGQIVGLGIQNLEKKMKHLESLGLLNEEVQQLLRKQPKLFSYSTDKMQRNMEFLTHTAGFQPDIVLSSTSLLGFSVENRLKPRLAVF